jgi:hypothetical protein
MKPKLLYPLLLIIFLACYSSNSCFAIARDTVMHARKTKKQKSPDISRLQQFEKKWKPSYDNCTFTNQYTIAQRLKKYPFSKAVKILAVSYYGGAEPNPIINLDSPNDTLLKKEDPHTKGLVIINDSLDSSTLIEIKTLNRSQIIRLTNILFNTDFRKRSNYHLAENATCFEPRNSILFLDKKGKIIDHLDVCFACKNSSSNKKDKMSIGIECTQKYDLLRKYFIEVGVKYGTYPDTN